MANPMIVWWLIHRLQSILSPRRLEMRRVAKARAGSERRTMQATEVSGRILVDVTMIAHRDAGTGIQRVVRSTMREMQLHPQGASVQPIRFRCGAFHHTSWPNADVPDNKVVAFGAGDVFLGLDMSLDAIRQSAPYLLRRKRSGGRLWFVVYDLLPLRYPQYFSAKVAVRFRWWLTTVAGLADGFLCISQHTAQDLKEVLWTRFRLDDIPIHVIPMGFDITPLEATLDESPVAEVFAASADVILTVGTLEPRKGHAVLLDAFEVLWARGVDATLIIVGQPGWKAKALRKRIMRHPEMGRRFHWLPDLDDAELLVVYDRASALVAASYDEGFGLPVLEAIARSKPILARDIPAFRAHAQHGVRYFPHDADANQIADAIVDLLNAAEKAGISSATPPALPSWQETSDRVLDLITQPL